MLNVMLLLAMGSLAGFNPIRFAVGFIVLIVVLAIVIIGLKWLLGLAGITVPQPLLMILGLLVFLLLFLALMQWSNLYNF
jgi:hypothetical protein